MTRLALAAALVLALPAALSAQEETPPPAEQPPELSERMGEAAREAWERLREEMAPMLEALEGAMGALGRLDDYGAPRMLENGDILIPRKPEAGPPGSEPEPEGEPESGGGPETLDL
jgi:hypothetical protein